MDSPEIHRIKKFENYDANLFEKLYKACKPLIRNLSRNIDHRRFNVSTDIIESYFWDKFMYVYNKYQLEYDEVRLRSTIITSLKTFKNKLLRLAYNAESEFNQDLVSLELLFDNNKELLDDNEEVDNKESISKEFNDYLQNNLSAEEYILYLTELNPPPFFDERIKESHGKLSVLHLIDFFELPRDKKSQQIITEMRHNIKRVLSNYKEFSSK